DTPRPLAPASSDTGTLFAQMAELGRRSDFPGSFLNPGWRSWAEFRRAARQTILDALGSAPPPVNPSPEVIHRQEFDTFTREKIVFSTAPELRVPAYLHLPKKRSGRLPAIVDLHSHGGMFLFGKEKVIDFGANHPAMVDYHKANYEGRPTATELVRRGYAVITIDAFAFGERRILMDDDLKDGWDRTKYSLEDVRRLNQRNRQKESTIVKTLAYAGLTWPGVVAWDDMRTVDYLLTRPEIDPARIGCVGVSMGGWRSLLLAGLDDRIAAGCVVGFMSTAKPMMRKHMDTHSFVHFIPRLHDRLDLPDVVALRAPKPLFVQQCRRDGLFPLAGMEESLAKIAKIYAKNGSPNAFTGRFYDQPHIFNVAMQDDAIAWFDQHLK
ncbi:MAG TPA: alpha/beta hydrolase family protein, partial [Bryobacteraceae bacterium]|nr:alpha/beta hydrolase family protein [Bryobacteraceae bacterium]